VGRTGISVKVVTIAATGALAPTDASASSATAAAAVLSAGGWGELLLETIEFK